MKIFLANIKKDIKLFVTSPLHLLMLLLPVVLLLALLTVGDGLQIRANRQPFLVAVRDRDETVMSRMLFYQMEQVDLIDEILYAGDSQTDEELFAMGCAAVVTLPEDFFYVMYDLKNAPVMLVLNGAMPVEASLTEQMIASVAQIAAADQQAAMAAWKLVNGDVPPDAAFYEETAEQIVRDALAMGSGIHSTEMVWQEAESRQTFFLAMVIALLCMLVALAVLRTFGEEETMGILSRFSSMHRSLIGFIGAKCVAMWGIVSVLGLLLCRLVAYQNMGVAMVILSCGSFSAFGMFFLLAVLVKDGMRLQLVGSLGMMVCLLAGGVYPYERLPAVLQSAAKHGFAYKIQRGLASHTAVQAWGEMTGVVICAGGCAVLGLFLWRKRRGYL